MPQLIALAYDTPERAIRGRQAILRLGADYLDDVGDAVIASVDSNGVIDLDQIVNLWSVAPKGKALWALLTSLLFVHPLLAVIEANVAGQVSTALSTIGLREAALAKMRQQLRPGHAILFLWLTRHRLDEVLAGQTSAQIVLQEAIDIDRLALVHTAFEQAHRAASRQRTTAYSGAYVGT